jgi:hypothetical protein
MLSRLRANPVIRTVLLAVALAFCGLGLAADWPQVTSSIGRLHWYSVTGAFLAAMAGAGCLMLAWRAILADLGSELPLPATVRVVSVAQVAKYLPGAVWAFAAQVELGRDYRVPARRGAAAVVVSLAIALGTGLLIGTAALPIASAGAARHYWPIMALAPVIAICLAPPVLRWLLDRAFALARQQPLEQPPSTRGLITAVAWTILGWVFWSLHAWLLIAGLAGKSGTAGRHSVLLLAAGAYALAWAAGILLVVFPGGIGPRELAFVVALAPVMPRGSALLVALMSRVVTTASDVAWASAGLVIGRLTRHTRPPAGEIAKPAGQHRKARWPAPAVLPDHGAVLASSDSPMSPPAL